MGLLGFYRNYGFTRFVRSLRGGLHDFYGT